MFKKMKSPRTGWMILSPISFCLLLCCFIISDACAESNKSGDRFSKDRNGIITDRQTGLQWYIGPNLPTSSYDATIFWNASDSVDGGKWRMPSLSELENLYGSGSVDAICARNKRTFSINPIFGAGCWLVWFSAGGTDKDGRLPVFNFWSGSGKVGWVDQGERLPRVFLVRSQR